MSTTLGTRVVGVEDGGDGGVEGEGGGSLSVNCGDHCLLIIPETLHNYVYEFTGKRQRVFL